MTRPIADLIVVLARRRVRVRLNGDKAQLVGPLDDPDAVTPELLAVVRRRQDELLRAMGLVEAEKVECLWPFGQRCRPFAFVDRYPTGARWYRKTGESQWKLIPGKTGEPVVPPPEILAEEPRPQSSAPVEGVVPTRAFRVWRTVATDATGVELWRREGSPVPHGATAWKYPGEADWRPWEEEK